MSLTNARAILVSIIGSVVCASALSAAPNNLPYQSGLVTARVVVLQPEAGLNPPDRTPRWGPVLQRDDTDLGPIPPFRDSSPIDNQVPLAVSPPTQPLTSLSGPQAATDFGYFLTGDLSALPGAFEANSTPEPSLGVRDQNVFVTGNWYAATSSDGGKTFSYVNPFTTFPSLNGGFCCDQVAIYEPSRNLFVWILQYIQDAAGNTLRLALNKTGSPTGGWYSYGFTPQALGYPAGYWFDFPDVAYGSNSLYFSANVFTPGNVFVSTTISRLSLDQLATAGSLTWEYLAQSDVGAYKIAQGIEATAYFAAHPNFGSVRIARWTEGSTTIFWDNVAVSAFAGTGHSCPDPSGVNWCGSSDWRDRAFWRSAARGELGVMWNAAQDGNFPLPHVRVAILRESDRALLAQSQIWSPTVTWQYPSAGVNARGDVAGSISAGSSSLYVSTQTWVSDDVNAHIFAPLENYSLVAGAGSPGGTRWGDFFTTRKHSGYTNSWNTVGAAVKSSGAVNPRFVWMGRIRDLPSTTGTIDVNATLDGVPWSGSVSYQLTGPSGSSGSSVPSTYTNRAAGSYTLSYLSSGPVGATLIGIMPSGTQALPGGGSITFTMNFALPKFYTVTPCRLADTRDPVGPSGGPALGANTARIFPVANICGIPLTATAVLINLAVFQPSDDGDLRVFPAGSTAPLASAINFRPGIVRANNVIAKLGVGGQLAIQCDMPSGSTSVFFDVYGYFQ